MAAALHIVAFENIVAVEFLLIADDYTDRFPVIYQITKYSANAMTIEVADKADFYRIDNGLSSVLFL